LEEESHKHAKRIKDLEKKKILKKKKNSEKLITKKVVFLIRICKWLQSNSWLDLFGAIQTQKNALRTYFCKIHLLLPRFGKSVSKEDNHHVSLSTSDAAYKLCSDYRCLLPKDNQRDILKVTSQETAVRYKILTVIAIKLDKRYSTNKSYVDYLKVKTNLFLFKEGAYKQCRFSAAIQKLRTLIGNSDLENVHKFALSKNIQEASVIVCTCCTLLVSLNSILMQVTLNKNSGELYL